MYKVKGVFVGVRVNSSERKVLQVSIDEIICGNRKAIVPEPVVITDNPKTRRLYAYYKQLNRMIAA
jgi:hypothetical protein